MKKLAPIAIIVLAGCAATQTQTPGADAITTNLEEQRRIVGEREKRCIDEARTHSRDELAHLAAASAAGLELLIRRAKSEREQELSQCRANEDGADADISQRERDEYAHRTRQEHDRAALMIILTASRPH